LSCGLQRGRFLLSDEPFPGSAAALLKVGMGVGGQTGAAPRGPRPPPLTAPPLQRPPFCPAKRLQERPAELPAELRSRGVAAGVAVLLRAGTGRILLTRRAGTLSTFPNVWVPPGESGWGGIGQGSGGLRELEEETGLCLAPGTFSWRMLGLWESIFPPVLSRGLPRRHHIVTYLLVLCSEPHEQLEVSVGWGMWGHPVRGGEGSPECCPHFQARMRSSESEVSAYAWLEPPLLEAIAATEDGAESPGKVPSALPATVCITELHDGSSSSTLLPATTFLNTAPAEGKDVERVSTGTKFALRLCLESLG
ncbi:NUD17 protein, partial [Atlantisia rogersi]|nr:NUD17 protein [Atlantisia rogersi]